MRTPQGTYSFEDLVATLHAITTVDAGMFHSVQESTILHTTVCLEMNCTSFKNLLLV